MNMSFADKLEEVLSAKPSPLIEGVDALPPKVCIEVEEDLTNDDIGVLLSSNSRMTGSVNGAYSVTSVFEIKNAIEGAFSTESAPKRRKLKLKI